MALLVIICLLVAIILFLLAGFNIPAKYNLMAFGLAAFILALLAPAIDKYSK